METNKNIIAKILTKSILVFSIILISFSVFSSGFESNVFFKSVPNSLPLIVNGKPIPIFVDQFDFPGVIKVTNHLKNDIKMVCGNEPFIFTKSLPNEKYAVIIGTIGKSTFIDKLIAQKKIDVSSIKDKWESTLIQVINNPAKGIKKALVIAGSDKRGTIYGIYELSAKIGVSPWYFWADMPISKHDQIYIKQDKFIISEPKVKYRGIFINDEAPALAGWATKKYGGFNSKFYDNVFELILRLKGNFLWPAMWGRAFYDDDPLNPKLADEYGVVIGTSHHEPMMRAHDEWRRFGTGKWNYDLNPDILNKFWKESIDRTGSYESLVTVGMRGDGDEPMSESSNIAFLEKIVNNQREIIEESTGKKAEKTPQVWALYKEVQDYYDRGMRVPEDITLLLCDDNWGNIRKLPKKEDLSRPGGFGMYYHYDYVGGPRNYKWLNTTHISRVWEQMGLCYQYGIDRIWIVNVGDIKPMEFPIEFFLDMAWNPDNFSIETLQEYPVKWAAKYFGDNHANEIGRLIDTYTKFNSRRKPELIDQNTYSITNYREGEKIVSEFNQLAIDAEKLYNIIPHEYKDAYYQLVLFPVKACANLNELYYKVALNHLYFKQGRVSTNFLALDAKKLYANDSLLSHYYNYDLANGKWSHMMDQTHIGYTYWQQPPVNKMPKTFSIIPAEKPEMRVSVEGSEKFLPGSDELAVLPDFDPLNKQSYYIDIYNSGKGFFDYTIEPGHNCLIASKYSGQIETEQRIYFEINWQNAPKTKQQIPIIIKDTKGKTITINANINNSDEYTNENISGFVESNGYVSIEAASYSRKIDSQGIFWKTIPNMGKTISAVSSYPVTAAGQIPDSSGPRLEYDIHLTSSGEKTIELYLSPTLNYYTKGIRIAVSIDNSPIQIIDIHGKYSLNTWEKWVADNIIKTSVKQIIDKPGKHILKIWRVDPGVVIQKVVINTGGLKPSYLGPPQSFLKQ